MVLAAGWLQRAPLRDVEHAVGVGEQELAEALEKLPEPPLQEPSFPEAEDLPPPVEE